MNELYIYKIRVWSPWCQGRSSIDYLGQCWRERCRLNDVKRLVHVTWQATSHRKRFHQHQRVCVYVYDLAKYRLEVFFKHSDTLIVTLFFFLPLPLSLSLFWKRSWKLACVMIVNFKCYRKALWAPTLCRYTTPLLLLVLSLLIFQILFSISLL